MDIHIKNGEIRDGIARQMNLKEQDLLQMVPSGKQTVFVNRASWAGTYLKRAGLIEAPSRAVFRITDTGEEALNSGEKVDLEYLQRFEAFRKFHSVTENKEEKTENEQIEETDSSPLEILTSAFKRINDTLASDLMEEVMRLRPAQFEALVVQLLLKMGYGDGTEDAGKVTQLSKDNGIDGIIKEDQLGFFSIYIQAKQWTPDRTVNRPDLQQFAGALQGARATKGLFITTAHFSSGARQYAETLQGFTIVLIDGDQLMKLMIKFNVGVSNENVYEIKRIDSDFFNEDL